MIEQLKARLGHDEHCRYFEAANNDRYCTCARREILEWVEGLWSLSVCAADWELSDPANVAELQARAEAIGDTHD